MTEPVTEPTLPDMPEPKTRSPHVLVVAVDEAGVHEFAIECPGVTDACRSWSECLNDDCDPDVLGAAMDDGDDEPDLHGVRHRYVDSVSGWSVPEDTCWPKVCDGIVEAAYEIRRDWVAGRYPIEHGLDATYDYHLTLTLIEEN